MTDLYACVIVTRGDEVLLVRPRGKTWQLPSIQVDPAKDAREIATSYISARLPHAVESKSMRLVTVVQDSEHLTGTCNLLLVFRCTISIRFAPRPTASYDEWEFSTLAGLPAILPTAYLQAVTNYFNGEGFSSLGTN